MTSRALQLQQLLVGKRCPQCGHKRLVQRRPMDYKQVRCMDCGGLFKLKRKMKKH